MLVRCAAACEKASANGGNIVKYVGISAGAEADARERVIFRASRNSGRPHIIVRINIIYHHEIYVVGVSILEAHGDDMPPTARSACI